MSDRTAGGLLFLPVPVVFLLFTQQPFGLAASLGAGVVLMVTHRLYARPFALARAQRRCLWCGGAAAGGPTLEVAEPLGTTAWRACGPAHGNALARVLSWAELHARGLRFGILGTLGLFLIGALLAGAGRLGRATVGDAVGFFRLGIAASVLPLGW